MMKETETCSLCGQPFPAESLTEFDGELCCESCLQAETFVCADCEARIWTSDNYGSEHTPLCQRCFDDHYTTCSLCDRTIHVDRAYYDDDESEPYCYTCHMERHRHCVINDYYYKPEPIFYGEGKRFFGVELEVDDAGECDDSAGCITHIANTKSEHIYCKHDGSLDNGFEIVTHPMALDYHLHQMPWTEVLSKLKSMGYLSHQAGTCGLHIHISRKAFGDTEAEQDACIARILYFFEKHWEELLKFSRRTDRQLQRWAARYGYKDHPMEILDHAKKGTQSGRYFCINLQNADTIEFRMFRGTLKYNTLIATLQLVNRVCDVAFCLSDEELKAMSWTTFVAGCDQPELIQYLKERRIYINEPVACEEEL